MEGPSTRWRSAGWIGRVIRLTLALVVSLVAVSALSNIGLPTGAGGDRLTAEQRARVAESLHLRRVLGDGVWPGWGSQPIPQIVYNESHAFLAGFSGPPPDGWYREPAHEHLGGPWNRVAGDSLAGEPVYRQRLPEGISPQAFTVRVGDRWTGSIPTLDWSRVRLDRQIRDQLPPVLEWIPPYRLLGSLFFRGSEHQVAITLHETFHAFQAVQSPEQFAAAESFEAPADAYPWDESGVVEAWREELEILGDAVEVAGAEEKRERVAAFLDARSRRRSRLSAELREYEMRREWLEGLAKYVEMEIWWAADTTASYRPAAAARAIGFDEYESAAKAFDQELGQLRRSASQGGTLFYYSGMAQARLLDQLGQEGWKTAAVPGGRFPEDLLREAIGRDER